MPNFIRLVQCLRPLPVPPPASLERNASTPWIGQAVAKLRLYHKLLSTTMEGTTETETGRADRGDMLFALEIGRRAAQGGVVVF